MRVDSHCRARCLESNDAPSGTRPHQGVLCRVHPWQGMSTTHRSPASSLPRRPCWPMHEAKPTWWTRAHTWPVGWRNHTERMEATHSVGLFQFEQGPCARATIFCRHPPHKGAFFTGDQLYVKHLPNGIEHRPVHPTEPHRSVHCLPPVARHWGGRDAAARKGGGDHAIYRRARRLA